MKKILNKYGYCYVGLNRGGDINAARSAASLREYDPNAHITLFTDQDYHGGMFDHVVQITNKDPDETLRNFPQYPDQGIFAKARCIPKAPYEYCIFSDYDVNFHGDISNIFTIMEDGNFDFCAAFDEAELSVKEIYPEIPYPMSKFHLGILAWHNTPAMNGLFDLWHELLIEKGKQGIAGGAIDEWTFSAAAYMSKDVRWNILPPNYCCRFIFPYIVRGEVKVLHGRSENYSGLIKKINENIGIRVGYNDIILARYEPGIGFINCMEAEDVPG